MIASFWLTRCLLTEMASKEPIEEALLELIKCSVCLDQVDSLKVLPCQHTICLTCVQQLTTRENRFKCPTCSKASLLPDSCLRLFFDLFWFLQCRKFIPILVQCSKKWAVGIVFRLVSRKFEYLQINKCIFMWGYGVVNNFRSIQSPMEVSTIYQIAWWQSRLQTW